MNITSFAFLLIHYNQSISTNELICIIFCFTGAIADIDCMDCPPGEYCEGLGNTLPTGLCDAGFYCGGKSYQKRPFDTGNLTTINGTLRFVITDENNIGGVVVSVLASSAVDCGFEPRIGKTKDYKIGICCFST